MKIHVLTLFPEAFKSFVEHSLIKRAQQKDLVEIVLHNLRDYAHDRRRTCDDRPFGGGPGMLMKPEPIFEAMEKIYGSLAAWKRKRSLKANSSPSGDKSPEGDKKFRFIYLSPQGKRLNQAMAKQLSRSREIVFLCGHYEGVDQRVIDSLATDEVSIGDYVLTQGELPAMVVIDSVIRLVEGVVGNEASKEFESFNDNLLEYPQYTRPSVYRGMKVPEVLLSGHHDKIWQWRRLVAIKRTRARRPDLLVKDRDARCNVCPPMGTCPPRGTRPHRGTRPA